MNAMSRKIVAEALDHPGAVTVIIYQGVAYGAIRQGPQEVPQQAEPIAVGGDGDAVTICTTPLPDSLVLMATNRGHESLTGLVRWMMQPGRRWMSLFRDHSFSAIEFADSGTHYEDDAVAVFKGRMVPLDRDELGYDEWSVAELLIALGVSVFPELERVMPVPTGDISVAMFHNTEAAEA